MPLPVHEALTPGCCTDADADADAMANHYTTLGVKQTVSEGGKQQQYRTAGLQHNTHTLFRVCVSLGQRGCGAQQFQSAVSVLPSRQTSPRADESGGARGPRLAGTA